MRKGNEIIQKLKEISSKSNTTTMTRKIFTSEKSKSVSESSSATRDHSAKSRPPKPVKNTVKLPPLSISVYATTETEIPFFISSSTSSPNLILGGGNSSLGSNPLSPSFGPNRYNKCVVIVSIIFVFESVTLLNMIIHIILFPCPVLCTALNFVCISFLFRFVLVAFIDFYIMYRHNVTLLLSQHHF
jgi:hypothetical protein